MAFARSPLQKRSRPHRRLSPTVEAGLLRCVYTLGLQPRGTACEMEGRGGAFREGEEAAAAAQVLEQFVSHSRRREGKGVVAVGPGLLTITVVQRPAGKVGQTERKKKRRGRHERRRKEEEDVAAGERREWEESKNHHHHVHFTSFYGLEFQPKYVKRGKHLEEKNWAIPLKRAEASLSQGRFPPISPPPSGFGTSLPDRIYIPQPCTA